MNNLEDYIMFDYGYTASSPPIVNVSINIHLDTFDIITLKHTLFVFLTWISYTYYESTAMDSVFGDYQRVWS